MEKKLSIRSFDTHLSEAEWDSLERFPVTAVLDNIRSAFNVGSILRTADSALIEKVVCCGITAHPPHKKLEKTSMGALSHLPLEYDPVCPHAVESLKRNGYRVYAMETTNQSRLLWDADFSLPAALVMGNEALGVSREVLDMADEIVEIPMLGYKNSLNVGVAFGIAVYHLRRIFWDKFPRESWIRKMNDWPAYIIG